MKNDLSLAKKYLQILIFAIVLLLVSNTIGYAQFIIGTFQDPRLSTSIDTTNTKQVEADSISFQKAKDAYFNLLTGYQDSSYLVHSEAGIDYALYIASKVGLKYFVRDPRFIDRAPFSETTAAAVVKHYKGLNAARRNAIYGYNIIDEPELGISSNIKKWISYFKKNDPSKLAYINLLPDFAFKTKPEYEKYLDTYLFDRNPNNNPNVVSYDHYPFHPKDTRNYFYNLFVIRKKAGDKPFWAHPMSAFHEAYLDPDENQLRFMVFCPLAYGAKGLIYFTYERPDGYKDVIMSEGKMGVKYGIVKTINHYITDVIAPVVMNSKNLGAFHKSNYGTPTGEVLSKEQMLNSKTPLISDLRAYSLLAGVFQDNNVATTYYSLVVNKSFRKIINVKIILKGGDYRNKISVSPSAVSYSGNSAYTKPDSEEYNSKSNETEIYINSLAGCEGRMIKITDVKNPFNRKTGIGI